MPCVDVCNVCIIWFRRIDLGSLFLFVDGGIDKVFAQVHRKNDRAAGSLIFLVLGF